MKPDKDAFIQFCRDHGHRLTRATDSRIMDAVGRLDAHFSQQEVLDELRAMGREVHRATVYRALPLLEQAGIIRQVHFHDGAVARYEHDRAHPHHDHLRCLGCGRVIEIRRPSLEDEQEAVCREHDFEPVEHRFWVVGYCRRCQRKSRSRRDTAESHR